MVRMRQSRILRRDWKVCRSEGCMVWKRGFVGTRSHISDISVGIAVIQGVEGRGLRQPSSSPLEICLRVLRLSSMYGGVRHPLALLSFEVVRLQWRTLKCFITSW